MVEKILTVDDSDYIREVIVTTLEMMDYECLESANGVDGLKKLKANEISLIITDINMPEMDGITFITEIRKINDDVPIIVLTTETDSGVKQDALNRGADGYLVKPFKPEQLIELVNDMLS